MADVRKMTDDDLEKHLRKLEREQRRRFALFTIAASAFALGTLMSFGLGMAGAVVATPLAIRIINAAEINGDCREEISRRFAQKAAVCEPAPVAGPRIPSPQQEFNPAAAVALEKDMRSMSPLRLKRKAAEFAHG